MAEVVKRAVPGRFHSEAVYRALFDGATDSFWLDSGEGGTSFLGFGEPWIPRHPVLDELSTALGLLDHHVADAKATPIGLLGWIDYETASETLGLELPTEPDRIGSRFLRVTRGIEVHPDGACELFALSSGGWDAELEAWGMAILSSLSEAPEGRPSPPALAPPVASWRTSTAEYLDRIAACQLAIREGDAYVLNLTTSARVPGVFDPLTVYRELRRATPAHHGGIVRIGDVTLVSSSPETFLRLDADRWMTTSPVKGTRRRELDPDADRAAADSLHADEKERAENLMIVDLMRNDFARVCEVGSVTVPELYRVETLARVHQLVSTVRGRVRRELNIVDVLRSCFPAGSMSGAPKRRAVELLAAIEGTPRGPYAGIFGFMAVDGTAEFAMTIRSIVLDGAGAQAGASVSAGGGITALSRPEAEVAEVALKAAPMLAALGTR